MEDLGVKYIINGRQGLNLLHQGHIFTKHFSKNGQTYYQCSQRQKFKYNFKYSFIVDYYIKIKLQMSQSNSTTRIRQESLYLKRKSHAFANFEEKVHLFKVKLEKCLKILSVISLI